MSKKLFCPFCRQKLDSDCINHVYSCKNEKCEETNGLIANAKMWNKVCGLLEDIELAQHNEYVWHKVCEEISIKRNTIRKALDVAVDALKEQQRWLGTIRISMVSHLNNEKGTVFQHYDADPTVLNIGKAKVLLNNALEQIESITKGEIK